MNRILISAGLLLMFFSGNKISAENFSGKKIFSVCVYKNEPKIIISDDNQVRGFHPEIINAIAGMEGFKVGYTADSWEGCLKRLENNTVDFVPDIAPSPEREKKYFFNNESILTNWACVYTTKSISVESVFDLKGKKIAVMKNSIHTEGPGSIASMMKKFDIAVDFIFVDSYLDVLKLLHENKCDAGVVNRLFGHLHEKKFDVVKTSIVFNPTQLKYGFSHFNSDRFYIAARLDEGLKKLKKNPGSQYYKSLEKLLDQHNLSDAFIIPSWLIKLIVSGLSVLLVVFFLVIILKVQVNRKTAIIMDLNRDLEKKIHERTLELKSAKDAAESANRSKSAFLASMSHELRTPLNSIIGFNGILINEMAGPLNFEQKKQLKMIKGSSQHLLNLINDVLDISKIEADELELTRDWFNMHDLLNEVVTYLAPFAEKKNLKLFLNVDSNVNRINGDERRMRQVLINIINNAVKFTESGEVSLSCMIDGPYLKLSVKDTGIGIKPDDINKLFIPFQQLDTGTTRQYEGTGLGLSICRKIIGLMGGEITAESVYGQGSTFRISIPLEQGDSL